MPFSRQPRRKSIQRKSHTNDCKDFTLMKLRNKPTMSTATSTRSTNTVTTTSARRTVSAPNVPIENHVVPGPSGMQNNSGTTNQPPPVEPIPPFAPLPPAAPFHEQNERVIYPRIRMPTFSSKNVEAWLNSLERWFKASGYNNDEQQFEITLAAIDPTILEQMNEALSEEPEAGKFNFVKQKLIAHFADSAQRKLNRLLSEMPLGDKRPSELFHEMKRVAGNVLGETALKGLWAQRLPEAARPVIAASTGTAVEFTRIADSIVDALTPRTVQAAAVTPLNEINELKAVIAELRTQINNFPRQPRSRSRSRPNQRPSTPANTGSNQNSNGNTSTESDQCWFHQKFGQNARNCRSPCRHRNQSRTPAPAATTSSNPSA